MAWTERYVRADAAGGGDGTTDANSGANGAWTLAEGITNESAGMRINMRAGTYANTTTNRTWSVSGTAPSPIWWRGFTSTAGDLDSKPTSSRVVGTDMPHVTWTTGKGTVTGAYRIFSNISWICTGAVGSWCMYLSTGGDVRLHRCRIENQDNNSLSYPLRINTGRVLVESCYLKAAAANAQVASVETGRIRLSYNVFTGGVVSVVLSGGAGGLIGNVFANASGNAIDITVTNQDHYFYGNTIYNCGGHGIAIPSTQSSAAMIEVLNNLFHTITGSGKVGINSAVATEVFNVQRCGNSFYNVTTPEDGLGDTPDFDRITEGSDPLTDPANGDFRYKTTATGFQAGLPGLFEGLTVASYASPGAHIPDETSSGGGLRRASGMVGGFRG